MTVSIIILLTISISFIICLFSLLIAYELEERKTEKEEKERAERDQRLEILNNLYELKERVDNLYAEDYFGGGKKYPKSEMVKFQIPFKNFFGEKFIETHYTTKENAKIFKSAIQHYKKLLK